MKLEKKVKYYHINRDENGLLPKTFDDVVPNAAPLKNVVTLGVSS